MCTYFTERIINAKDRQHNNRKTNLILTIAVGILNFSSFVLHTLGIYLLFHLYQNEARDSQDIYLINLSVIECIMSLFHILVVPIPTNLRYYFDLFQMYGLTTTYYMSMTFLTADRLFFFNIRYPLYFSQKKTKCLLTATWCRNVTTSIIIMIIHKYDGFDFHRIAIYVILSFDFVFTLTAFVTYGYIFHKFAQSRTPPSQNRSAEDTSLFVIFRNSRFYVTTILMATFLAFTVAPDVIPVFFHHSKIVLGTCRILYAIFRVADAFTYILMKQSVKDLLLRKLHIRNRFNNGVGIADVQHHIQTADVP